MHKSDFFCKLYICGCFICYTSFAIFIKILRNCQINVVYAAINTFYQTAWISVSSKQCMSHFTVWKLLFYSTSGLKIWNEHGKFSSQEIYQEHQLSSRCALSWLNFISQVLSWLSVRCFLSCRNFGRKHVLKSKLDTLTCSFLNIKGTLYMFVDIGFSEENTKR